MRPPGRSVFALRFPQRRNNPTYESISGNYVPIPGLAPFPPVDGCFQALLVLRWRGVPPAFHRHTAEGTAAPGQAQHQVADFVAVDCADIWAHSSDASDKNPLYWLRGIDCADRLAPAQARAEAKRHTDDSWQDAFRRGILLADAKITPEERRDLVARLDTFSPQIAVQVARCISSGATARPVSCSWWKSVPVTLSFSSPAIANWRHCVSRSWRCASSWS
ncbi:alpha helix protein [Klebsiella pneumoniae]|nr:alpha helix protein [Klebsiella pneumoniae]